MAGTNGGSDRNSNSVGIVQGHAYNIIDLKVLSNRTKLIKLFNPWARDRFTGNWSDSSPLWTDALRAEVGSTIANDGHFWMSFEDYFSMFSMTYINMDSSDWYSSYFLKINDTTGPNGEFNWCGAKCTRHTLSVTSSVAQDVYITAHSWEDRMMAD